MSRWNHNVILFRGISISYQQCAGGGSLANQEIERVQTCLVLYKRLVISFAGPSRYCHQPVLTSLGRFVENFSHHLASLRPTTYHCLHLLIVLSSLVCRKYFLIYGGYFVPTFPEEILISYFLSLVSIKNVTLVAIFPKQLRFLLGSSLQQISAPPCGALDRFRKFGLGRLVTIGKILPNITKF